MAKINDFLAFILIALIRGYRYVVSGLFGHCCRFEPSCSLYAIEAIKREGCIKGCWLMLKRLSRCHPFHKGGIDPLP